MFENYDDDSGHDHLRNAGVVIHNPPGQTAGHVFVPGGTVAPYYPPRPAPGYPVPAYPRPYPVPAYPQGYGPYPQPQYPQPQYPQPQCVPSGYPTWAGPQYHGKILKTIGVAIDCLGAAVAAMMPVPGSPQIVGVQATDDENMKRYQEALARHAKLDERIRTVGKIVREALSVKL